MDNSIVEILRIDEHSYEKVVKKPMATIPGLFMKTDETIHVKNSL